MKRGTVFIHARWLDGNNQPLRCIVTRVAQGVVWWKQEGERKAKFYFPADAQANYVKEIIKEAA